MSEPTRIVPGIIPRVLRNVDFEGAEKVREDGGHYVDHQRPVVTDAAEANVLTSVVYEHNPHLVGYEATHAPVIDLDFPCSLLPSSTPGHYHLIMDKKVPWTNFVRLLETMADIGLVEPGYLNASKDRGYSSIRLPWSRKETPKEDSENDDSWLEAL